MQCLACPLLRYESVIATLCENLDSLDEPEARAAMIWIVGEYAERIDNADELLESFLEGFHDESTQVCLDVALLYEFPLCRASAAVTITATRDEQRGQFYRLDSDTFVPLTVQKDGFSSSLFIRCLQKATRVQFQLAFVCLACVQVQLQLLTAIVKLFLKKPTETQELVQQVLSLATQVRAETQTTSHRI